jgi:hypothetical protein
LDLNHRANQEKSVSVQKLEDLGLSLNQTLVGVMLVILGFITYYCVPLTFFYGKTEWFLFIFDTLLIMIIIGLTFMSVLLFEYIEKGMLWVLINTCCKRDRVLKDVISKNLDGHRRRNSKTSIMFTLAISFLIFAASSFTLLSGLIQGEVVTIFGSDLYVESYFTSSGHFLDELILSTFLEENRAKDGAIESWAYISVALEDFMSYISNSGDYNIAISGTTGYNLIEAKTYAVP